MPEGDKKHVRTEFGKGKGPAVGTKDSKEQHPVQPKDQASQAPAQYVGVDFPSKYLVYPGLDPTKVGIRLLKGKDEKLIAELDEQLVSRLEPGSQGGDFCPQMIDDPIAIAHGCRRAPLNPAGFGTKEDLVLILPS